jgi:hypothetical protein
MKPAILAIAVTVLGFACGVIDAYYDDCPPGEEVRRSRVGRAARADREAPELPRCMPGPRGLPMTWTTGEVAAMSIGFFLAGSVMTVWVIVMLRSRP